MNHNVMKTTYTKSIAILIACLLLCSCKKKQDNTKGIPTQAELNTTLTSASVTNTDQKKNALTELINMGVVKSALEIKSSVGREAFKEAIKQKNDEIFKLLLAAGAEIEPEEGAEEAPLYIAAGCGYSTGVKLLIKAGADVRNLGKNDKSALSKACREGSFSCARLLLEAGADIESADKAGWTALIWASRRGHDDCVKLLLETGAKIDAKDKNGRTPLMNAIERNKLSCAKILLASGADIGIGDNSGETALTLACYYGNTECLTLLLEHGADKNHHDTDGASALMKACMQDQKECVQALIDAGANLEQEDKDGWTALMWACAEHKTDCVKILLDAGADVMHKNHDKRTALDMVGEEDASYCSDLLQTAKAKNNKARSRNGGSNDLPSAKVSELVQACSRNDNKKLKALLDAGADANAKDENGVALLSKACMYNSPRCVKELLMYGASINSQDEDGTTALVYACKQGAAECVRVLIQAGADVSRAADDGTTPVDAAWKNGHDDCVELLLEAGAKDDREISFLVACSLGQVEAVNDMLKKGVKVNACDDEGHSALYFACISGCAKCVQALIDAGADVTQRADDGTSPVWAAWLKGHNECIQVLLKAGAKDDREIAYLGNVVEGNVNEVKKLLRQGVNVNAREESSGNTALHYACIAGQKNCVKVLLDAGIKVHAKNKGKEEAITYAEAGGFTECVRLIKEHLKSQKSSQKEIDNLTGSQNWGEEAAGRVVASESKAETDDQTGSRDEAQEAVEALKTIPPLLRDCLLCEKKEFIFMKDGSLPYAHGGLVLISKQENAPYKDVLPNANFVGSDGKEYNWRSVMNSRSQNPQWEAAWLKIKRIMGKIGDEPVLRHFNKEIKHLRKGFREKAPKKAYMRILRSSQ